MILIDRLSFRPHRSVQHHDTVESDSDHDGGGGGDWDHSVRTHFSKKHSAVIMEERQGGYLKMIDAIRSSKLPIDFGSYC